MYIAAICVAAMWCLEMVAIVGGTLGLPESPNNLEGKKYSLESIDFFLVNLFLTNLVRISGFSSLFLAIAVFSAHFAREC